MWSEGPVIERLTHRLADAPPDFLSEPAIGGHGLVHVGAVVSDLIQDLGGAPLGSSEVGVFQARDPKRRNLLRLVLIGSWLLHDDFFLSEQKHAKAALAWLAGGLEGLAALVAADLFVSDPDRREELARLCLSALGLRPKGESDAQARDRLNTLSSVEREKVIRATREQLERAQQIREAMRRKAAEEAAAKVSRE